MTKKYKRVFVPNPNYRFDPSELGQIADEVVYVCDRPMFDNLMGPENIGNYEAKIAFHMHEFDPETDVIAYYGDSMIFALMIMYLTENFVEFDLARYSVKTNSYSVRSMNVENFTAAIAEPAQKPAIRQSLR